MSDETEKYREKLEEIEAKQEEERRKNAKLFNIDDILADSEKVKEVYIPGYEIKVRYKELAISDSTEIRAAKDNDERTYLILYKMLNKADPSVTLEKVQKLPLLLASAIIAKIVGTENFLQALKPSKAG